MKKVYTYLAVVLITGATALSISSCDPSEYAKLTVAYAPEDIELKLDSAELTGSKGEILLTTQQLYINVDSILKANSAGTMEEANMLSVSIGIIEPSDLSLKWLKSARLAMQSGSAGEAGIASIASLDTTASVINFTVDRKNITDYVKQNHITLKLYGDLAPPFPAPQVLLYLRMRMELLVQLL